MDNLRFIRETMERAGAFTGISGWGQVAIGATALIAAPLAAQQPTFKAWLLVWLVEGLVSLLIAGWSIDRKARAAQMPLLDRSREKSRLQSFTTALSWSFAYGSSLSRRTDQCNSRSVAVALRHGRGYWRHVLGNYRADHGHVLYGFGGAGAFPAARICELVFGGGLRRPAHYFRRDNRKEVRWLSQH